MNLTRLQVVPGVWIDARRAAWLERERVLAVADLHLGYAWAHRHAGNLLPIPAREETRERLVELVESYAPRELVLLGDIVHRALPVEPLRAELRSLCEAVGGHATLCLIAGNHDANLAPLLRDCGVEAELRTELRAGPHLFVHGDAGEATALAQLAETHKRGGLVIIGHEHPAISISDGVATSVKCPCFLVHPELIVLPAFSPWAAGSSIRRGKFLSHYAHAVRFEQALAIVGGRLMPLRP